jgi:hypothetical protein
MNKPTYSEIASSFALWQQYVDPQGLDTEEAFNSQSVKSKISCLKVRFGPDIAKIVRRADQITVINDGQVRFPIETSNLNNWIAANGPITTANYERFCHEVEYIGAEIGTPGNASMVNLCDALIEAGADCERL